MTRARWIERGCQSRPARNSLGLTERQMEVARLCCRDLSHAEVGERLSISAHTVHTHWENIAHTLGLFGRCRGRLSQIVALFDAGQIESARRLSPALSRDEGER